MHLYGAAEGPFHLTSNVPQPLLQPFKHVILKSPQASFQMGMGRQGVADGSALEFAEFQQPENSLGQRLLQSPGLTIEFYPGSQGVNPFGGFCNVGRLAENVYSHFAGPGHQLPLPAGDNSGSQSRPQVQPKNGLDPVDCKNTGFTQFSCAPGGLLRRLEYQQHIVGQGFLPAQPPGQFQQYCHMPVMAAGMHLPRVLGGIGSAGFLFDG